MPFAPGYCLPRNPASAWTAESQRSATTIGTTAARLTFSRCANAAIVCGGRDSLIRSMVLGIATGCVGCTGPSRDAATRPSACKGPCEAIQKGESMSEVKPGAMRELWLSPDALHERKIASARARYVNASASSPDQRAAWETLQALIKSRSPEQVERMEREKGLQ